MTWGTSDRSLPSSRKAAAMKHPENVYVTWAGVCIGAGIMTMVVLELARHLSYLKHRDTVPVPGTQHWCLVASIICYVFCFAAIVFIVLWAVARFR